MSMISDANAAGGSNSWERRFAAPRKARLVASLS